MQAPDDFPEASSLQRAILRVLIGFSWLSRTVDSNVCTAMNNRLSNGREIEWLPHDFWKQEVLGWERDSFAGLHVAMSRYARGGEGSDAEQPEDGWFIQPESEGEKQLCSAQKMIKSGGFV